MGDFERSCEAGLVLLGTVAVANRDCRDCARCSRARQVPKENPQGKKHNHNLRIKPKRRTVDLPNT